MPEPAIEKIQRQVEKELTEVIEQGDGVPIEREYEDRIREAKREATNAMLSLTSEKDRNFVREYIKTGNGTKSYQKAKNPLVSDRVASVSATRLLHSDRIQSVLRPIASIKLITPEHILGRLVELAAPIDRHPDAKNRPVRAQDNIGSLALMSKIMGFTDQPATTIVGNVTVAWSQPEPPKGQEPHTEAKNP